MIRERAWAGSLEGMVLCVFFLALLLAYLPLGFQFSLVNFTYGAGGLDPAQKALIGKRCAVWFVAVWGYEVVVRGAVLRFLLTRFPWRKALAIQWAAVMVCLMPFLVWTGMRMGDMGLFRVVVLEGLLEVSWALFFLRTGSLLATALLHTGYNAIRFVVMNDVAGPFETLYFYSAASDHFYWLMLAVALLAGALLSFIVGQWGVREHGSSRE